MARRQAADRCTPIAAVLMTCVFAAIIGTVPLASQERGLYGPEGDGTEAFIRVVNSGYQDSPVDASVGSVRFTQIASSSPYRSIRSGVYIATAAGHQADLVAAAGQYVTLAVANDGIRVYKDERHDDPARSQLVIYNLGHSAPVTLRTSDGSTEVIGRVEMGESKWIVVNSIAVELAVYSGSSVIGSLEGLILRRGQSYSIFVRMSGDTPLVEWKTAEVALQ